MAYPGCITLHEYAPTVFDGEQPVVLQPPVGTCDSVEVDGQVGGELSGGW
jgi:hypothetical protein